METGELLPFLLSARIGVAVQMGKRDEGAGVQGCPPPGIFRTEGQRVDSGRVLRVRQLCRSPMVRCAPEAPPARLV